MMGRQVTGDSTVLKRTLGILVAMVLLRLVLTIGDTSTFCTPTTSWLRGVALLFDALIIFTVPLAQLAGTHSSARTKMLAVAMTLAGFMIYQLVRNPCLLTGLGR